MSIDDNRYKVRLIDGHLYDPWSPSGTTPSPETVAHGLANLCRYGGHVRRPYSVCEHSLWVALRLLHHDRDMYFKSAADDLASGSGGYIFYADTSRDRDRVRLALLGLVHDAPEGCGLVDVPGPILRHEEMAAFKAAHERCANWLLDGWSIARPTSAEAETVKAVDYSILGAELVIRPCNADEKTGSGESLPRWSGISFFGEHDLTKRGETYVREAWIDAFHFLKQRS